MLTNYHIKIIYFLVVANNVKGIFLKIFGGLRHALTRFPDAGRVRPELFAKVGHDIQDGLSLGVIAIQSVPDKFYFLLFGAILAKLKSRTIVRAELVVVGSVSTAIGTGWAAEAKRSALRIRLSSGPWVRAYGDLVDGVAYRCATWAHPVLDLSDWIKSNAIWEQLQQQGQNFTLLVDGIEVGDLLIDSYLRFKPSPEFDVKDAFVRRLVWQALRDVRQAQVYFRSVRPRWYLTSYSTYLEHGIPVRVALKHGVKVWSFGTLGSFGKRLHETDYYHTPDYSLYKATFDTLACQDDLLEVARTQLEYRLAGGIDAATSYMRNSAYGQSAGEIPSGVNGALVIFLHDFYDSPHAYPELIFNDFWHWINFTIEVLKKAGINFFIKPHPNQIALSDKALDRLRQQHPELQWLGSGVSNVELVNAGMACGVTVYGTVAHELAYLGTPTICCARHPHHDFEFCRTAHSLLEYEGMLLSYQEYQISETEMRREALIFYYMNNVHKDKYSRELQWRLLELWKGCNFGHMFENTFILKFDQFLSSEEFGVFVESIFSDEINNREPLIIDFSEH